MATFLNTFKRSGNTFNVCFSFNLKKSSCLFASSGNTFFLISFLNYLYFLKSLNHQAIKGETNKQLLNKTIGEFIVDSASKYEHRDAFRPHHEHYRWTYLELKKWIDGTSSGLHTLRYTSKPGQSMVINLKDNTEHVVVNLALSRMGCVGINIPFTRASEMGETLLFTQPLGFIYDPEDPLSNTDEMYQLLPELRGWDESSGLFKSWRYPSLKWIVNTGHIHRLGQVTLKDIALPGSKPDVITPQQATVLPSYIASGYLIPPSTDLSQWQADYYSHSNVINLAHFLADAISLTHNDRVCTLLPLYSPFGQSIGILSPLSKGAFVVLHSSVFNPEKAIQAISIERCNYLFALPSHITAISRSIESSASTPAPAKHSRSKPKADLSSLNQVLLVHQKEDPVTESTISQIRTLVPSIKNIFVYSDGIVFDALNGLKGKPLPNVEVKLIEGKEGTVIQSKGYHNRTHRIVCDEDIGALRKSPNFKAYTWNPKLKTDTTEWITSSTKAKVDSSGVLHLNL